MSPSAAPGWSPARPTSLAGYLEALSRPVFSTGMSYRVVEAKWADISAAFHGFDPVRVAAMTPDDIERLVDDPRVIRNRKKLEAMIQNAERLLELDGEPGGFAGWLDSLGSFEDTVAGLRGEFRFVGDNGAYLFLWTIDRPVPPHQEWFAAHRGPQRRQSQQRGPRVI
jgi:DNA-3-methyladenine glycosylase I